MQIREEDIEEAYTRAHPRMEVSGNSARHAHRDAPVAFITLNPGGSRIDPAHGVASCEIGSAYVHESSNGNAPGNSPCNDKYA